MAKIIRFEASVQRRAYNYGYDHATSMLYSCPDVALRRRSIQRFRVATGHADPVYGACIVMYPHKFVTEQLSVSAKKLFGGKAINWVKDGINDAFDVFLKERK